MSKRESKRNASDGKSPTPPESAADEVKPFGAIQLSAPTSGESGVSAEEQLFMVVHGGDIEHLKRLLVIVRGSCTDPTSAARVFEPIIIEALSIFPFGEVDDPPGLAHQVKIDKLLAISDQCDIFMFKQLAPLPKLVLAVMSPLGRRPFSQPIDPNNLETDSDTGANSDLQTQNMLDFLGVKREDLLRPAPAQAMIELIPAIFATSTNRTEVINQIWHLVDLIDALPDHSEYWRQNKSSVKIALWSALDDDAKVVFKGRLGVIDSVD